MVIHISPDDLDTLKRALDYAINATMSDEECSEFCDLLDHLESDNV